MDAVQKTTMRLRGQVGGFFGCGATFSALESGRMTAFGGIGDWSVGVPERNGAAMRICISKEGRLRWTGPPYGRQGQAEPRNGGQVVTAFEARLNRRRCRPIPHSSRRRAA